jgi:hypothetical protein
MSAPDANALEVYLEGQSRPVGHLRVTGHPEGRRAMVLIGNDGSVRELRFNVRAFKVDRIDLELGRVDLSGIPRYAVRIEDLATWSTIWRWPALEVDRILFDWLFDQDGFEPVDTEPVEPESLYEALGAKDFTLPVIPRKFA